MKRSAQRACIARRLVFELTVRDYFRFLCIKCAGAAPARSGSAAVGVRRTDDPNFGTVFAERVLSFHYFKGFWPSALAAVVGMQAWGSHVSSRRDAQRAHAMAARPRPL